MSERKPHAIPGNKHGLKLKKPDVRQEAFQCYLKHIASGMPKEAFHFNNKKGYSVCWKTMDRYIEENPSEFPAILMEEAKSKRYAHWLNEGAKLMTGQYKNGSPVVWQTIMRNIFRSIGWDKDDNKQMTFTPEQETTIKSLFKQISDLQQESKKSLS